MTITKLGIYKTRGGGEARVAAIDGNARGYVFWSGEWLNHRWFLGSGEWVDGEHREDIFDLVELIQEWPEGK